MIRGPCPDGAQRPTGPKTNSGAIPHRITPPGCETVADLSRQRARAPKASPPPGTPAPGRQACRDSAPPRRPHRPEGQSTPRWFAARPHRGSRPACQHRNLIRRAAGRCRSGDVRERRVGKARFFFSSQERPKEAVEADLRVTGGPVRLPRERLRSRICSLGRGWMGRWKPGRERAPGRRRRPPARPGAGDAGPGLAWRPDRAPPEGRAASDPDGASGGTQRGQPGGRA